MEPPKKPDPKPAGGQSKEARRRAFSRRMEGMKSRLEGGKPGPKPDAQ